MRIRDRLLYIFFPRRCGLCNLVISPQAELCPACRNALPLIVPPVCPKCGDAKEACVCGERKSYYIRTVSPFYYEAVVRKGMHRFKFQDQPQRASYLAGAMLQAARREYPPNAFHIVTCVPLSPARLCERGYNQSALLAEPIAKALQLPFLSTLLVKLQDTGSQQQLHIPQRRANVLGIFGVDPLLEPQIENKRILLCDDIVTTGATLDECAKMLLIAGAQSVCCLTAARTRKRIRRESFTAKEPLCSEQT